MALDVARITDVLTRALLRDLGDEVDLVFRYGSRVTGTAHRYSDVDLSYVPVHQSTWSSITVMVDDVLCDLYPVHWATLQRMAAFRDVSCTILLHGQIVHRSSEEAEARFRALGDELRRRQRDDARPEMLAAAMEIHQEVGYPLYQLRRQAAAGHLLACLQHARRILDTVLHSVMVCNQAPIDTRDMAQVLALPRLPVDFGETAARVRAADRPDALLAACETLVDATRELLLAEQREVRRPDSTFPEVFQAAYPELKGDLQHILLACERGNVSGLDLVSLYHELMIHIAEAMTGIPYSGFNSLSEYEQDLVALGFPDLIQPAVAGDVPELHRRCLGFDGRLRAYLGERSVELNTFATPDDLEAWLAAHPAGDA